MQILGRGSKGYAPSFAPHILFLAALAVVAVVGLLWNLQSIAVFIGAFAALCTDPLLVLIALAIGALSRNLLILLLGSVVAGIVFSLYIANINHSGRSSRHS